MNETATRVRINPEVSVGGPGSRTELVIPITVEGATIEDVYCYVAHPVQAVRKARALRVVNALNTLLAIDEVAPMLRMPVMDEDVRMPVEDARKADDELA